MALSSIHSAAPSGDLHAAPPERRAFPRFQWKGTAALRILPNGPDVLGVIADVSQKGCGIELGIAIPAVVGDKVSLELHIRGLTLKPTGIIRNIRLIRTIEKETRVGIEFLQDSGFSGDLFQTLGKGLLSLVEQDSFIHPTDNPAHKR